MSGIRPGDFCIVMCAPSEETSISMTLHREFGNDLNWAILPDPRIPSGQAYMFNQSYIQRKMWGGRNYPPPRARDLAKCAVFSYLPPR